MILLNFDIEEFDLPLEQGVNLSLEEQIEHSKEGTRIILDLLEKHQINATFFCTAVFATHAGELIYEMINRGHEVASHGYSHSSFVNNDLKRSKQLLEEITGTAVNGYRMPLMKKCDANAIADAGYLYDSSINPTYIPGRYNNWSVSRTCFKDIGILEIPASVSPLARLPLFWLSMHNFPLPFYIFLCRQTLNNDGYLNVYFHSWEFCSHLFDKRLQIPFIVRRNSGNYLQARLERFIQLFLSQGETFHTINEFVDNYKYNNGLKK
ncbi:MAG: polysaccharide deacetylase family protein [Bacteroidetes bacterium]|nr:polysaccharide deacetylase family protein [Bacteroidota bacterium]